MSDDANLLRQYVTEGSEAAFAELVRRHVDLVHSAALRQVGGDLHRAQDVTQAVFCELARKAPRLLQHRALSGWLYTTARFVGARFQRMDSRRIARELTSQAMTQLLEQSASDPAWRELQPVLDDAMQELAEKDCYAIVLRFFENKPLAEVGLGLGLSENAARMRVERAIEKLRGLLARRGVTSTTSLLGAVLVTNAVVHAPTGLAATVVGPALASGLVVAATGGGAAIGVVHLMTSTKLGMGIAAIGVACAVGTYVSMDHVNANLRTKVVKLQQQAGVDSPTDQDELARLRTEHSELLRLRGEIGVLHQNQAELSRLRAEKAQRDRLDAAKAVEEQAREAIAQTNIAKMTFVKQLFFAFEAFAVENGGRIPETFEQAAKYLPQSIQPAVPIVATDDFEIIFKGSLSDVRIPSRTIIVREKQPFDVYPSGGPSRTYLFADGHSEIHEAPDGNFEPWEQERMASGPK